MGVQDTRVVPENMPVLPDGVKPASLRVQDTRVVPENMPVLPDGVKPHRWKAHPVRASIKATSSTTFTVSTSSVTSSTTSTTGPMSSVVPTNKPSKAQLKQDDKPPHRRRRS